MVQEPRSNRHSIPFKIHFVHPFYYFPSLFRPTGSETVAPYTTLNREFADSIQRFVRGCRMATAGKKQTEVQIIDDIAVVNFTSSKILDEQVIQKVGDELTALVEGAGHRKVVLNFNKVDYLSSAALGKFISLHKKLATAKGKLILTNIDESIFEIFEITGLKKVFTILPDEQDGLAQLQK